MYSLLKLLVAAIVLSLSSTASAAYIRIIGLTGPEGHENIPAQLSPFTYTDQTGTFTSSALLLTLSTVERSFLNYNKTTGELVEHIAAEISFNDGKANGGSDITGLLTIGSIGISPGFDVYFNSDFSAILTRAGLFDFEVVANHRWKWNIKTEYYSDIDAPINFASPLVVGGNLNGSFSVVLQQVPEPSSIILTNIAVIMLIFLRRYKLFLSKGVRKEIIQVHGWRFAPACYAAQSVIQRGPGCAASLHPLAQAAEISARN